MSPNRTAPRVAEDAVADAGKRRAANKSAMAIGDSSEHTSYIGLGANLGDALRTLRQAALAIGDLPLSGVRARSSIFRSAPIGPAGQDDYLNAVLQVQTALSPSALLKQLQRLETSFGRVRGERWGARTLDLDVLLYGDRQISSQTLTVPHPRMHERNFVLLPLSEILDTAHVLPTGVSLHELIRRCPANAIERTSHLWKNEHGKSEHGKSEHGKNEHGKNENVAETNPQ